MLLIVAPNGGLPLSRPCPVADFVGAYPIVLVVARRVGAPAGRGLGCRSARLGRGCRAGGSGRKRGGMPAARSLLRRLRPSRQKNRRRGQGKEQSGKLRVRGPDHRGQARNPSQRTDAAGHQRNFQRPHKSRLRRGSAHPAWVQVRRFFRRGSIKSNQNGPASGFSIPLRATLKRGSGGPVPRLPPH